MRGLADYTFPVMFGHVTFRVTDIAAIRSHSCETLPL